MGKAYIWLFSCQQSVAHMRQCDLYRCQRFHYDSNYNNPTCLQCQLYATIHVHLSICWEHQLCILYFFMKSKLITPLTDLDKSATITYFVEIMLPILMLISVFPESFRFGPPDWLIILCFTPYRKYPSRVTAFSQLHVKSFEFYVTMLFLSGYCCNFCLLRTPIWFPPYHPKSWFQCYVIVIPHIYITGSGSFDFSFYIL